eukprot:1189039-Prorocentrum_minimum.AAC.1
MESRGSGSRGRAPSGAVGAISDKALLRCGGLGRQELHHAVTLGHFGRRVVGAVSDKGLLRCGTGRLGRQELVHAVTLGHFGRRGVVIHAVSHPGEPHGLRRGVVYYAGGWIHRRRGWIHLHYSPADTEIVLELLAVGLERAAHRLVYNLVHRLGEALEQIGEVVPLEREEVALRHRPHRADARQVVHNRYLAEVRVCRVSGLLNY